MTFEGLVGADLAGDGLAQPIGDRNQHHAVIAVALQAIGEWRDLGSLLGDGVHRRRAGRRELVGDLLLMHAVLAGMLLVIAIHSA